MAIKIRPSEQVLLDSIAQDSNDMFGTGVQVQPTTPVYTEVYPIDNYATSVPPASATETKVKKGVAGNYAPLIRRIGPITGQIANVTPSFTINTAAVDLLTLTLSENLEVARTVEVSVNGTAYSDVVGNKLHFWINVNGINSTQYKFFFNENNSHRTFSGSWIVSLPAGAVTLKLQANRNAGSGNVLLNTDDFVSLTFKG